MDQINISYIDVLILLPLAVGLVRGLMRGLVTELVAILAVVLGVVGARLWAPQFRLWILSNFTWPESVASVVAYTLLFLAVAIACNWVGKWLSRLLRAIHLGWLNRLLGGLFGALKWAIIVLVMVFIVSSLDDQFHFLKPEAKSQSVCYRHAVYAANHSLSVARSELGK